MARSGRVLVGLLLACTLVLVVAFGRTPESAVPPWLAAVHVTAGLVCRAIARRRWERLDWLRLRPIRWLTPGHPRAGSRGRDLERACGDGECHI